MLGNGDTGHALDLLGVRPVRLVKAAVIADDPGIFLAQVPAQIREIEHDRKARAIADEHLAVAIQDIAPRTRYDDAALILQALALAVEHAAKELPVREPSAQYEYHCRDDAVEGEQPRVEGTVGFDGPGHGKNEIRPASLSRRHAASRFRMLAEVSE